MTIDAYLDRLKAMLKTKLIVCYNLVVNRLSFYHGLYKMRRWLNAGIDRLESIESFPESHPRGFIKKFRKRRISIVILFRLAPFSFSEAVGPITVPTSSSF